jgi:hypothetical protein
MSSPLQQLVLHRCRELGPEKAGEFFQVAPTLIRQWLAGSKTPSLAAVEKVYTAPESPPTDAPWGDREVFLALPFYKTTSPRTLWSILGVWDRAKFRAGTRFDDAFIVHARNQLADDFLATNVPKCFWVDDDIIFGNGSPSWFRKYADLEMSDRYAGINAPVQLASHGKSIVSGVYVGRHQKGRANYAEALAETPEGNAENAKAHAAPFDGLRETKWAGLGCLLHTREVLTDIQKTHPHLAPTTPGQPWSFFSNSSDALMRAIPELKAKVGEATEQVRGGTAENAIAILADVARQIDSAENETKRTSKLHQGEDETFGRRAATAGHSTWIDFSVVCGHLGTKVYNCQNTDTQ